MIELDLDIDKLNESMKDLKLDVFEISRRIKYPDVEKKVKTGYIYARESSDDTKNAPNVQNQIDIGKKVIKRLGYRVIDVFSDVGVSGGAWEREGLNSLKEALLYGSCDFIWVFNQDRLARDTELFRNLYRTFRNKNIKIYFGLGFEEITMDKVGDMAKFTITALADEMYKMNISEKVKASYQHKKQIAEESNIPIVWGRRSVPEEFINVCLNLKKKHKNEGCRLIAKRMPPYRLKELDEFGEPRMRFVSHVWVSKVLKEYYKEE